MWKSDVILHHGGFRRHKKQEKTLNFIYQLCNSISLNLESGPSRATFVVWLSCCLSTMSQFYSQCKNTCEEESWTGQRSWSERQQEATMPHFGKNCQSSEVQAGTPDGTQGRKSDPKVGWWYDPSLRILGIQYRKPERNLPEEVKEDASYRRRALRQ